jgi:nucleoside-diphosphate-sugar epimerase
LSNSIEGKNVIVTGSAGVIGREVLRRLATAAASVLSIDREPLTQMNWEKTKHLRLNLDRDNLTRIRAFKPQVVVHLAASFERSIEAPGFWDVSWRDDVVASHRFIEAIKDLQSLETFVFASTYLIYSPILYMFSTPRDVATHLKEDDAIEPRNLCGAAKYYTERELHFVKTVINPALRVVNARIYRVYGQRSRDIISRWMRAGRRGERIDVYNSQNRFDFVYAGDVAEALVRLANTATANGPVNVGTGEAVAIADVLETMKSLALLRESGIVDHGVRESFEASCADTRRLEQMTGWKPSTTIAEGIQSSLGCDDDKEQKDTS